jgi:lysophospholipase L1-like esterase
VSRFRLFAAARFQNLVFMGDSLTAGTGSEDGATYPQDVAAEWSPRRWYYNGGVGSETSSQILTRYLALDAGYRAGTLVIWAGRNNYTDPVQVQADTAAMVAAHAAAGGGDRHLVLSIINGNYPDEYEGESGWQQIVDLNADLAETYGEHFVDVRGPLVEAGAPDGITPNPTDYALNIPPSGVRFDNIHLLNNGYAIVAAPVYAKVAQFGW